MGERRVKESRIPLSGFQIELHLAMHPDYDAKELFEALKENDIYVRFWGSERIEQYMRITAGTREEMEAMFAFLKKYMNK